MKLFAWILPVACKDTKADGELKTYHKRIFELCRKEYEEQYQTPVDSSGSDIGREGKRGNGIRL